MGLKDIKIDISYESQFSKTYLLEEFYIPVLEQSCKYYRIAGYFNSTALSIASKGIEGLIHNNGKMFLLISPKISLEDLRIIEQCNEICESSKLYTDLFTVEFANDNLKALAWMLKNNKLEIKIAVGRNLENTLFHEKIGILFDTDNQAISFSGSINETASAWLNNIEEFKVFKSWVPGQLEYLNIDYNRFLQYWNNKKEDIAKVYDLPSAVKNEIIKHAPSDINELKIMQRYQRDRNKPVLNFFPHQVRAIEKWFQCGNSLLMEMATGTGKTRTAIGCLLKKISDKKRLLTIIATPQNTLSRQWLLDFNNLKVPVDRTAIIDGTNHNWRKDLALILLDLATDKITTGVVFTTHDTSSSNDFISTIKEYQYDTEILFICDEVHAVGAAQQRKALLKEYKYRIGLSATPERMFDEEGTTLIRDYFGKDSFEFTIYDALHTINELTGKPFLNQYNYCPVFVRLNEDEMQKYKSLTKRVAYMLSLKKKKDKEFDESALQRLYDQRADILKNAENKIDMLAELITIIEPQNFYDTIIFVTEKQMEPCLSLLASRQIKRAKITEEESATKKVNILGETERQSIISAFARKELQAVLGIKCLDEGIDIINARVAILMASTTNPREFIQRVGRVIRPAPNKDISIIYDMIVLPDDESSKGILEKEAKRAYLIAVNAVNFEEVKVMFEEKGVILDADKY